MRAILLQKDDYGLQKDRLHGRYGLTGKPTLTQTSIAGSLGTSFKAGQTVTLSNLRSLTAKLKEASLAISGSNANIQEIADNINKTNEASGEANKLLNDNLWQKFWDGTISPQSFYAAKYNEDESNERMLGEPGFPCTFSPFILPRTPFWDHIFEIRNHKTDPSSIKDDDLCFINNDGGFATKIALSQNLRTLKTKTNIIMSILVGMAALAAVVSIVSNVNPGVSLMLETEIGIAILAITIVDKLVDILINGEITELGGKAGRGATYLSTHHSIFDFQNWIEVTMMDPNAQIILDGVQTTLVTSSAIYATGCGIQITGYILYMAGTLPWIQAVGWALMQAGNVIHSGVSATFKYTLIPSIVLMIGAYMVGGICSRSPGKDENAYNLFKLKADFAQYADKVDETPYSSQLFTCYGTLGQLPLTGNINSIPGINKLFSFISAAQSKIASALGAAFSWILKERYFLGNSGFDRNSSEIRIYNYLPFKDLEETIKLQDFWGIDTPSFTWNYNLPNFDTIGAGSYVDGPLEMEQSKSGNKYISLKARIYNGNIYKIKAINKKSITHTVVIKGHMVADKKSNGHQWEYFSELALVCLDGDTNHLYLHHERNAIYNIGSVKAGSSIPTHAEQSFWNFDFKAGSSPELWSCRCGRMNYGYVDFADNVRLQYRPLTNFSNNYLAEELINTEYKYNNFFEKTTDMDVGMSGGLQSYANVNNV